MKKKIHAGLTHPLIHYKSTNYIRQGFAVAELQKAVAKGYLPTDFSAICADHVIILITSGTGLAKINGTTAQLRRGILLLQPAAACMVKMAAETTGWIVSSTTNFILNGAYDIPATNEAIFYQMWTHPVSSLNEEETSAMEGYLTTIDKEYKHADDEYKHSILQMLMRLLITALARGFRTRDSQSRQTQSTLLFERFYSLVACRYTEYATTQEYAQALAVSPATLLHCTQHVCGLSPIDIHRRRLVAETCSLLVHTNLAVADIMHLLGRDTITNFTRFFKCHTGLSPAQYRRHYAERGLPYFYT